MAEFHKQRDVLTSLFDEKRHDHLVSKGEDIHLSLTHTVTQICTHVHTHTCTLAHAHTDMRTHTHAHRYAHTHASFPNQI